ncbi:uncharacterized protein N7484_004071 [Penicillium longicatenatum]|uniref:uncharacterized protein n=1 Tax=Penicillium longicatenatum TaxID=1561947 RepID=UPI0025469C91|nr:uncharacterized protein N7484_004071 [Penicillium longicatenatum]KAJ5650348.1 hypothetical protein N7484_004071 [Penicillium longicatenatum]
MPLAFAPLQTIPEGEVFELRLVDSRSDDDLLQPLPPWDPIKASTNALQVTDPVGAAEVQTPAGSQALGIHLVNFHWTWAPRQEESSPLLLLLKRQEGAVE